MQPHERIGIGFKGRMGMGRAEAPRSLRSIAMVHSGDQKLDNNSGKKTSTIAGMKAALFSVSYATLGVLVCATAARAQTAGATQPRAGAPLPPIQITAPQAKRRTNSPPSQRAERGAPRSRGRGAGSGLLNRTIKEADGTRVYDASVQTGSWNDRRFTLDAGQAVNENVAVRLNAFYEGTDTFRDFGQIERYGINPTITLKPADNTKIRLSYEYFHDDRTSDRRNPSQALNPTSPAATP